MKNSILKLPSYFDDFVILRYLMFGTVAALVQMLTLIILVETVQAPVTALSCVAFTLAVLVNYSLQRSFTFNSDAPHIVLFPKFAMVSVIGFFLNAIIFYLFSRYLHYLLAQVLTILLVLIFNFIMNRHFVFSQRQKT